VSPWVVKAVTVSAKAFSGKFFCSCRARLPKAQTIVDYAFDARAQAL